MLGNFILEYPILKINLHNIFIKKKIQYQVLKPITNNYLVIKVKNPDSEEK